MMAIVVKSVDEDVISLPSRLMTALDLREGDAVKTIVDGQSLRLTPLDTFLRLRGVLANDEDFDRAMECITQTWESWTITNSV